MFFAAHPVAPPPGIYFFVISVKRDSGLAFAGMPSLAPRRLLASCGFFPAVAFSVRMSALHVRRPVVTDAAGHVPRLKSVCEFVLSGGLVFF